MPANLSPQRDFPSDYSARVALLKTGMVTQLQNLDARLNDYSGPPPTPHDKTTTRDTLQGALAKAILGTQNPEFPDYTPQAIEDMINLVWEVQNMDETSPDYGTVPWALNDASIVDANAIEFAMQPVGAVLDHWGGCFDDDFKTASAPHLSAAITALRRHHASIPVGYTNIHLMNSTNLVLLGEATDDLDAANQGYSQLDDWINYTKTYGLVEFDSPTYFGTDLDSLLMGYLYAQNPDRFRRILNFISTDIAAHYFLGKKSLSGAHSRDYGFWSGHGYLDHHLSLMGFNPSPDSLTPNTIGAVFLFENEVQLGYQPDGGIFAKELEPERVVRGMFGPQTTSVEGTTSGKDHYTYLNSDVSVGTASNDYGPQDKMVNIELNSSTLSTGRLTPVIATVIDNQDSPYGDNLPQADGHSKPVHMSSKPTSVQDKGNVLTTFYLGGPSGTSSHSFATNVIFPANADSVTLNGVPVDMSRSTFSDPSARNDVVGIRINTSCAAFRIFEATEFSQVHGGPCDGRAPDFELKVDARGRQLKVGRYVVYYYNDPQNPTDLSACRSRVAIIFSAGSCEATDAGLQAFTDSLGSASVSSNSTNPWTVGAEFADTHLELKRDLNRDIYYRTVNGADFTTSQFSFNDVDQTPILDR